MAKINAMVLIKKMPAKNPNLKSQGKHSQAHGSGRGRNYATSANEKV